jgi:hypothetical protein
MRAVLLAVVALFLVALAAMAALRWRDTRADAAEEARLLAVQPADPARFDPAMVAEQPFGGVLSDWRAVQGFRVPFRVEAGNMFGTPDYFPVFIAEIGDFRFPPR